MKENILEIEKYAKENNVPIIEKDSISYIMQYIKEHNVKSILEIPYCSYGRHYVSDNLNHDSFTIYY